MSTAPPVVNPNDLTDRAAMGLPDSFVDRTDHTGLAVLTRRLVHEPPTALVRLTQDPAQDPSTRFAAGRLLALLGDPHIDTFDPAMVDVPGGPRTARPGLGGRRRRRAGVEPCRCRPQLDREGGAEIRGRHRGVPHRPLPRDQPGVPGVPPKHPQASLPTSWTFGAYPAPPTTRCGPSPPRPPTATRPGSPRAPAAVPAADRGGVGVRGGRGGRAASTRGARSGRRTAPTPSRRPAVGTTPIGASRRALAWFGAHDMAGNVEEYVADDYRPYPGAKPSTTTSSAARHLPHQPGRQPHPLGDLARCARGTASTSGTSTPWACGSRRRRPRPGRCGEADAGE